MAGSSYTVIMTKKDAIKALGFTASLLELLGENEFRAKAYQTAERALDNLAGDWDALVAKGFVGVRGIGTQLAANLSEFHATGKFVPLEELKALVPNGVVGLFRVRGLGAKKIRVLWDAGIDSLPALIMAARENKLAPLKGFGAGSQAKILEAAEFTATASERRLLPEAEFALEKLVVLLEGIAILEAGGSTARHLETIGDLDVIALGDKTKILERLQIFSPLPDSQYPHLLAFHFDGFDVQLCCATPESIGAARFIMTGSKPFLESALAKATELGLTISSENLTRSSDVIATPTEQVVFAALEMPFVPTFWREAEHLGRAIPTDLVQFEQIQGMLHCHSTYSDGSHSIREMSLAAKALGMTYFGICDHSRSAFYANGLSIAKVREQWQEIDTLNAELEGITILKGIESDILTDGSLDYPDEILAGFDFIVASIHSQFTLSSAAQTQRLIKAVQNPFTTILGHPSGRLLLRRPPYEFDVQAVLEAARMAGTIIEINANPNRLDIDWRFMLEAKDNLFAINTDAHSTAGFADLRYGVHAAQKGGLPTNRCVNTWSKEAFLEFAQQKRQG